MFFQVWWPASSIYVSLILFDFNPSCELDIKAKYLNFLFGPPGLEVSKIKLLSWQLN